MKKILLSIATIMITAGAYAQTEPANRAGFQSEKKYYSDIENPNHPDGFMLQNGDLMMVKKGEFTRVENDTTLSNGTVIMSDGYYMKKDESKMMFKEDEHMDMSGEITTIDKSNYKDDEGKKSHPNGYIFQDGKVMKVKNGEMTPLNEDVKLINGTVIMSNGYYMKEGESKMKFKEGEHMDMSGEITQINKKKDDKNQNKEHPLPNSPEDNDY
ncbi:DUF6799 domain-containing protein [Marivirga sp.]|uniref:DUF6799 domain-containing protein n=1 Tax=Marivirga sp. TaxID=2018662 RepID=UPI0025E7F5AC|nr:DUF6799 domain-containing protein [Marivirga sp.]